MFPLMMIPSMLLATGPQPTVPPPVANTSPTARYWLAADDTYLRPGEDTYIYLWIEYKPGPNAPVFYKEYPAKVLWHAFVDASILCDQPWPDTYLVGVKSITQNYQGQLLEYQGTLFEDGIFAIHFINAEPGSGKPGYAKTPMWLYVFRFIPKNFDHQVYTFTIDLSKTFMALEVPALNKYFPNVQYAQWPHTGEPPAEPLRIRTGPACFADCLSDGTLNIDDFICFQTLFAVGDMKADCDADGQLLIDDFICFQTAYTLGC
jgi:hypothetical protein